MKDTLQSCKMFVFDLDGTLYLGDEILPGAHEIIEALDKAGICYIYLTNNSSRAAADYVTRLERMGFPCTKANVMSSSMATAEYLKENYPCQDVYLVGTDALYDELKAGGLPLSDTDPGVVCVGFDTQLTYDKLNKATHFLRRGAAFVAANPNEPLKAAAAAVCAMGLHLSHAERRGFARLRRHLRAAYRVHGARTFLYRQAQPADASHAFKAARHSPFADSRCRRQALYRYRRRGKCRRCFRLRAFGRNKSGDDRIISRKASICV